MDAIDQTTLLESCRNHQRSADETQRVKAESLRSYATLAGALGFGARIVDAGAGRGKNVGKLSNLADDMHVGLNDGVLPMGASPPSVLQTGSSWEVELSRVYHRGSLPPLWRDLRARVIVGDYDLKPRAVYLDHMEGAADSDDIWYRFSAYRFVERNSAISYCNLLRDEGAELQRWIN